jgi:molybdenum transport protein
LKTAFPALKVLMAGGIRRDNVEAYAASGVDGIVLSSLYHAKPADLGVRIQRRD